MIINKSIQENNFTGKKNCGFWCGITRSIVIAIGTAAGGPFGGAIAAYGASFINFDSRLGDFTTLSQLEIQELNDWINSEFMPKLELMLRKGNTIFQTTNINNQLAIINDLSNELAVVKGFLERDKSFSSNSKLERDPFCLDLLTQVEILIEKTVSNSETKFIEFKTSFFPRKEQIQPLPLLQYIAYGINYRLLTDEEIYEQNIPTQTGTPIKDPFVEVPKNTTTTDTATTNTSNTDTKPPLATKPKKTNWILWLLGAGVIYKIIK